MVWYSNDGSKTGLKKRHLWSKISGIWMVHQVTWLNHLNTGHTYCPVFRCIWYSCVRYSDGYCTFKDHQVTFVCQGLWVEVLHFWRKIWPWQLLLRSLPDLQPDIRFLPVAPWSWCNAWGTLQTPPPKSCQRPVIQKFRFLGLTLYQASPKSRNEFAKMAKTKVPNKI